MKKRLRVYDDITYPLNLFPLTFPVQDNVVVGADVNIIINPVRSTNNNYLMGIITISYTGGVHFLLSFFQWKIATL